MEIRIKPQYKWSELNFKEFWEYRDLIILFVRRNYSTRFKQTILGPAWLIISPLFTVISYTIVFGGIAGLSTDDVPRPVFYMAGNILWTFFAGNVSSTSNTFINNAGIFGKIYFPRLITPISTVLTNLADFFVQLIFLVILMLCYKAMGTNFDIKIEIIFFPLLLLELGLLGMGTGLLISSLTTKYRDLMVFVGFGLQIWMYLSPVIYSVSLVPETFRKIFMLNPVTPIFLIFKYCLFGIGGINYFYWGLSWIVTLLISLLGIIVFNKVEKTFLDTV